MAAAAVPAEAFVLGAILGAGYALLGIGLILAFRASGTLNLALGQCGALAAVLFALAVERWRIPYWWAFGLALLVGGAAAAAVEVLVVRSLRSAPAVVTVIATLGAGEVLAAVGGMVLGTLPPGFLFPQPPLLPSIDLGALTLTPAYLALLVLTPAAVALLWFAGSRTRAGLAFRAAGDSKEGARVLGLRAGRLVTGAWAVGGALAALAAILTLPAGVGPAAFVLGPALLLRALAVAAIAGMSGIPAALAAGTALGIGEQVVLWYFEDPGAANALVVGVIGIAVLARRAPTGRTREPRHAWLRVAGVGRLHRGAARPMAVSAAGVAVAAAVGLLPLLADSDDRIAWATVLCFAAVGLSVWLVTGLGGLLSLGQFAFAGIGALAAVAVARGTGEPLAGLAAAPAAGAVVALAAGLAARDGRPIDLPIVTLGVAVAVSTWLLPQAWAFGGDRQVEPLAAGPLDVSETADAYMLALALLAGVGLIARRLSAGGLARRAVAVRDNPAAAAAFGVSPRATRLLLMTTGGALAGAAGAVLVQVVGAARPSTFAAAASIEAVAIAAVGGLGWWAGPLLGALYIVALPRFVDLSAAAAAATAAGWLSLLVLVPGGLAALLARPRERGSAAPPGRRGATRRPRGPQQQRQPRPLVLRGLEKRFGTLAAVDGADLTVSPGEVVVVVGANGAGKTTLLDLASGVLRPDAGTVALGGHDLTASPPHVRARRGLVRSFQDATLFPTLNVLETVSLVAPYGDEASTITRARALVAETGLQAWERHRIGELSAGVRRLVEIACVLAHRPAVLLLDEPSAGVAAPERDRLVSTLRAVQRRLGIGMLVVTQDGTLAHALADRLFVMDGGRLRSAVTA